MCLASSASHRVNYFRKPDRQLSCTSQLWAVLARLSRFVDALSYFRIHTRLASLGCSGGCLGAFPFSRRYHQPNYSLKGNASDCWLHASIRRASPYLRR